MTTLRSEFTAACRLVRSSTTVRWVAGVVFVFVCVVFVLGWRLGFDWADPESKCSTRAVETLWSADRQYKATLLKKDCNMEESISYTVRLDFFGATPGTGHGWFIPGYELESDDDADEVPQLRWTKAHQLDVIVSTRTLAGTLVVYHGQDMVYVRHYVPREPGAFPN